MTTLRRRLVFSMMALVALTLCLGFYAMPAGAQGFKVTQPPPDCRLFRQAWDNPYDDTHMYRQPRIAWHAEAAVGSMALAYAVHKVTRLPPWASAAVATIGLGVVPHVRSVLIQRRYPINPGDLAFDLWDRSTPAFYVIGHRDDSTKTKLRNHAAAAGTWILGYAALACFASP